MRRASDEAPSSRSDLPRKTRQRRSRFGRQQDPIIRSLEPQRPLKDGPPIFGHSERRRSRPAHAATCGIAVMAKASTSGKAKTRLSPPLTPAEAAEFNTAFLRDVANNLLAAASQTSIRGMMAFGPRGSEDFFTAIMPREIDLIECWLPDFGDCLFCAISTVLSRGFAAAVVLNADSPTLPAAYLVEAAEVLARREDCAALGPSSDGGYYLLGLKKPYRRLFEDIIWSTEHVAEQTIARAREIGLPVHVLPTWYDVDDCQSLRILHGELFGDRPFQASAPRSPAHHTRALMQRLLGEADLARRLGLAVSSPSSLAEGQSMRPERSPPIAELR
jgi:uncharacterized protein